MWVLGLRLCTGRESRVTRGGYVTRVFSDVDILPSIAQSIDSIIKKKMIENIMTINI